jgi:two-component system sensor histidine kinase QseC
MIKSIKYFLLISLLLSITIASVINGIGNYVLDAEVIQPYLDGQLIRLSSLISILNQSANSSSELSAEIIDYLRSTQPATRQKFLFQVWDKSGKLIMQSSPLTPHSLKNAPIGFSDQEIKGDDWRIYNTFDKKMQSTIIVAELYNIRRELADDIARSNANILLITYPVFGLLVWFIISLALRSVSRVTTEISSRASTYLEPVQLTKIPLEIKPLVGELNQLFIRLKLAFERNKRFSADAAHELRTPLAALKTHAQVALKSDNESDRTKAIEKEKESVNLSSHVVAQ